MERCSADAMQHTDLRPTTLQLEWDTQITDASVSKVSKEETVAWTATVRVTGPATQTERATVRRAGSGQRLNTSVSGTVAVQLVSNASHLESAAVRPLPVGRVQERTMHLLRGLQGRGLLPV
ncbi:uncharacterized protein LOC112573893 [Pomacea canaliculata]|uniref:uncharacterized protein LOC112573893 n=1 Tax=Pomacea canaliculata TaxID=400727 RepID=UPI000D733052|nr:uncharacterized protein LOC112573893 [Pomacea canaliculata]